MTGENGGKPLELLVIDDEEGIRNLLKAIIESTGSRVTTAKDGMEGIIDYTKRLMNGQPYDAVITDLAMKNGDGTQVTQFVKSLSPQTQVIVITGREANEEYQDLSQKLGQLKPDGILQKPFEADAIKYLVGQIQAVLQKRKVWLDYQPEPSFYIRPSSPPTPQS